MKSIIATNCRGSHEIIISDEDCERASAFHWNVNITGYAKRSWSENNKSQMEYLHHFIIGKPKRGFVVDHINGNKLDNRRENLRILSHNDNLRNRKANKNSVTGIKGVCKCKITNKYSVSFGLNGKRRWLGRYNTIEEAKKIYNDAVEKQFGEVAYKN